MASPRCSACSSDQTLWMLPLRDYTALHTAGLLPPRSSVGSVHLLQTPPALSSDQR